MIRCLTILLLALLLASGSERLNQHRVTSSRSPAPEPGAETQLIPSLVEGFESAKDWNDRKRPELLKLWMQVLGKVEPSKQDRRWFGDIRKARILDQQDQGAYTRIKLELPMETDFFQPHL